MRHAPINLQNRFTYLEKRMAYRLKQLPFQCWDLMSSRLPQHLHLFPINGNCSLELWSIRLRRNGIHTESGKTEFWRIHGTSCLLQMSSFLNCHAMLYTPLDSKTHATSTEYHQERQPVSCKYFWRESRHCWHASKVISLTSGRSFCCPSCVSDNGGQCIRIRYRFWGGRN